SSQGKPRRSEALAARSKYDHTLAVAKSAEDRSIATARQEYIAQLPSAVKAARQNKDLGEANRINGLIEAAKKPPVATSSPVKGSASPPAQETSAKTAAGTKRPEIVDL